jgi:hypothetical protein
VPELPELTCSLLVRTDFTSDDAWREVRDQALRGSGEGFRAYLEPVSDPAFGGARWEEVKAAVPADEHGAPVLFIAGSTTLTRPGHPVLVVDLLDDDRRPFRCIPPELRGIDVNLNIANVDWAEFADAADENGVFRGFPRSLLRVNRNSCVTSPDFWILRSWPGLAFL